MKRSIDRILTTHVGSLIRPAELREFLSAKEAGRPFDQEAYAACLKDAVADVVHKQAKIGIDLVSDGEFGKAISWAQYPLFRLGGFERRPFRAGKNPFTRGVDRTRFPEYRAWLARQVEVTNHAIAGLPRERIRYHVCWGSWPGPHSSDVPFKDIADLILRVRAGAYSIELANPRHEHEWRLWEHLELP